jgi:hypothetical protein
MAISGNRAGFHRAWGDADTSVTRIQLEPNATIDSEERVSILMIPKTDILVAFPGPSADVSIDARTNAASL